MMYGAMDSQVYCNHKNVNFLKFDCIDNTTTMKGSLYNFRKIKLTNEEERSEDKTEVHQKRPPQTLQPQPPPVSDKVEDV